MEPVPSRKVTGMAGNASGTKSQMMQPSHHACVVSDAADKEQEHDQSDSASGRYPNVCAIMSALRLEYTIWSMFSNDDRMYAQHDNIDTIVSPTHSTVVLITVPITMFSALQEKEEDNQQESEESEELKDQKEVSHAQTQEITQSPTAVREETQKEKFPDSSDKSQAEESLVHNNAVTTRAEGSLVHDGETKQQSVVQKVRTHPLVDFATVITSNANGSQYHHWPSDAQECNGTVMCSFVGCGAGAA